VGKMLTGVFNDPWSCNILTNVYIRLIVIIKLSSMI